MSLRHGLRFPAAILAILMLSTCGREEPLAPPHVTEPPVIESISQAPWTILTGEVRIQVAAPRAETVTLQVDDRVTATASQAPFELLWDTGGNDNGSHAVRIVATNRLGSGDSTLVLVTNNPGKGVAVLIAPREAIVDPGDNCPFQAQVLGTSETDVTWEIVAPGTPAEFWGAISGDGRYAAPASVPAPPTLLIVARSVADPGRVAAATVRIAAITVAVDPPHQDVIAGRSVPFTASVTGALNPAVTWSVDGAPERGTITADGIYTAPDILPDPPLATVLAASVERPSKQGSAEVRLIEPSTPRVLVSPAEVHVPIGVSRPFQAVATGVQDRSVTWSVDGGDAFGTVTAQGLYLTPAAVPVPPTAIVRATSVEVPAVSGTAIVHIEGPVTVAIVPADTSIVAGATLQLTAVVTGASDPGVMWSIEDPAGRGTITTSGLYTAPAELPGPPTATVVATSVADPSKNAHAAITILPSFPPEQEFIISNLAGIGYQALTIELQAFDIVLAALWLVREKNAGRIATTGVLDYVDANTSAYWPDPQARSLLVQTPDTWFEITTETFTPDFWQALFGRTPAFLFQGSLACRLAFPGGVVSLRDESHATESYETEFERTVHGTLHAGPVTQITITDRGATATSPHVGIARHHVTGTAGNLLVTVQLDEASDLSWGEFCYQPGGTYVESWTWTFSNFVRRAVNEYRLTASVAGTLDGHCGHYSWPLHPERWLASGTLTWNDAPFGAVRFSGPVVTNQPGPDAVIGIGDKSFVLRRPGLPTTETLIPNPLLPY